MLHLIDTIRERLLIRRLKKEKQERTMSLFGFTNGVLKEDFVMDKFGRFLVCTKCGTLIASKSLVCDHNSALYDNDKLHNALQDHLNCEDRQGSVSLCMTEGSISLTNNGQLSNPR